MAESVKITNLPAISALTPNDILPVVDESETQTSKATISQIQALGPGENTVSEDTIQDGAVTKLKHGFSSTDLIVYAGTSQTTGGIYKGEETTLTEFGRDLIACVNSTEARGVLNESPEFYDGIYVGPGIVERDPVDPADDVIMPSIVFIGTPGDSAALPEYRSTGFFSSIPGEFGFSSIGREIFGIRADGSIKLRQFRTATIADPFNFEDSTLVQGRLCTAYASFDPGQSSEFVSLQSAGKVAEFFGVAGTLAWNQSTGFAPTGSSQPYAVTWGTGYSNAGNHIFNYLSSQGYFNIYAQKDDPSFRSFTGIYYNYHSPENNSHYFISSASGSIGGPISAHPKGDNPWIGAMTFQRSASNASINRAHNVRQVTKNASAPTQITLDFVVPMPDDKYTVAVSASNWFIHKVIDKQPDSVTVQIGDFNNGAVELPAGTEIDISIFR